MDEKLEFNKYIDFMCDYLKISLEKQTESRKWKKFIIILIVHIY